MAARAARPLLARTNRTCAAHAAEKAPEAGAAATPATHRIISCRACGRSTPVRRPRGGSTGPRLRAPCARREARDADARRSARWPLTPLTQTCSEAASWRQRARSCGQACHRPGVSAARAAHAWGAGLQLEAAAAAAAAPAAAAAARAALLNLRAHRHPRRSTRARTRLPTSRLCARRSHVYGGRWCAMPVSVACHGVSCRRRLRRAFGACEGQCAGAAVHCTHMCKVA